MDTFGEMYEKFKVQGRELGDKIAELIHEGNVRRIIVKDERGHTFMEIPLTVATIGIVAAPVLAAVGAIATLVARFEIVVERSAPEGSGAGPGHKATDSSVGATEDQMNMRDTVPQHMDNKGTRAEDLGGTGEHDAPGG